MQTPSCRVSSINGCHFFCSSLVLSITIDYLPPSPALLHTPISSLQKHAHSHAQSSSAAMAQAISNNHGSMFVTEPEGTND